MKKLMKAGIVFIFAATIFAMGSVGVFAQEPEVEYGVYFNGEKMVFDQDPVNVNERVLVPMRAIFEAYGADVEWDGDLLEATASAEDIEITLRVGSEKAYINGKKYALDAAPVLINDRTLVPVRFVSEALEADVEWDNDAFCVIITTNPDPAPEPDNPGNAVFDEIQDIVYDAGFFSTQEGISGACYLTCLGMVASNLNEEEIRASHVHTLNGYSVNQHDFFGLLEKLNIIRQKNYNLKGMTSFEKITIVTDLLRENPSGVIVRFLNGSSSHYVVCRGFQDGKLIVSDPVGQICVPLDKTWTGYSMFKDYNSAIEGMVLAESYKIGNGSFSWDFLNQKEDPEKDEEETGK